MFSDWRARHLYPGLHTLHGAVDSADNVGDVFASFGAAHSDAPLFGVADVVEVDAVDVISTDYLTTDISQIGSCLRVLGIHECILTDTLHQLRLALAQLLGPDLVPLADRDGHHPRVAFHTPLVALVDAELQRVVAGGDARGARETAVPGLELRGIDSSGSHARLHEYSINTSLLELV